MIWTLDTNQDYVALMKCMNDPDLFVEYVLDKRIKKEQKNMWELVENNQFSLINAARQAGKTDFLVMYICWYVANNPDHTIMIKTTTRFSNQAFQKLLEDFLKDIPLLSIRSCTNGAIRFHNGARIIFVASMNAARGHSVNLLVVDELAHQKDEDEFLLNIMPVLASSTGKLISAFTPKAKSGTCYRMWNDTTVNYGRLHVPGTDIMTTEELMLLRSMHTECTYNREVLADFDDVV